MRDAGCGMRAAAISTAARSPLIMSASRIPHPASRFFPGSRRPARLVVHEEDHRPDLALGEEVLPPWHRRVPRRTLARQARPTLGHPPEHEALGELRDGPVVLEIGRDRVEARGVVPLAVQVVAVTREAILIVDPLAQSEVPRE